MDKWTYEKWSGDGQKAGDVDRRTPPEQGEEPTLEEVVTPGHHPKVFASLCVQMHSHLPAAIPEQALCWWCPDPAAESTLGDGPSACWTFLGALKPSSQQLNRSP